MKSAAPMIDDTGRRLEIEDDRDHMTNSHDTPLRPDAFRLSDDEKIDGIAFHFGEIMQLLGLDLNDDSLRNTPYRVAKMYVTELFSGLHPDNRPQPTLFDNKYGYNQMLVEKNVPLFSSCEHHFVPIYGKAHIAYISTGKIIGLSKLNRIVAYFAQRPQVQERLTVQIGKELQQVLQTDDVAVVIEAMHMCVCMRGVRDEGAVTVSSYYSGKFLDDTVKKELLTYLS
ncbi:GTP cyclohydrolase I FolE [Chitinophagaceae bacterium MMS25-I14]